MKIKNKWKVLFLTLLAINLVCVLIFFGLLFTPNKEVTPKEKVVSNDYVNLSVETNKEDLTRVINNFLKKEAKDNPLNYKVLLTERVMLLGTIQVFGKEIDMVMTFKPKVLENGDLLLQQEAFTVGQVSLPVTFVLRYINDYYNLPEWVQIDAKNQDIYVYLSEMKMKSDTKVEVDTFDLSKDELRFKLQVPLD
ncbi:YpmS family protein [Fredinandcohnia sp. QZ13]|uniref:YpmS family protein n=1 Tax=Fredinandcohnia sp. QZ13 TaxID=3073144 RepID=UPI0028533411|nr:YpmS family protein [Fredinandcohnia sp. QZ13]MDR4888589.1 YpmS family protein [Fredinandcohnia sp. QZ13]